MKHSNNTKYEKLPLSQVDKGFNGDPIGSPESGNIGLSEVSVAVRRETSQFVQPRPIVCNSK